MLYKRLGELREEAGISRAELAKQIGISPSAMGNYENGGRVPDADIIIKLSDFFNVSTDYLLGKIDQKSISNNYITEITGLDEKSISILSNLIQDYKVVNGFICHSSFSIIISSLGQYLPHSNHKKLLENLEKFKTTFEENGYKESFDDFHNSIAGLDNEYFINDYKYAFETIVRDMLKTPDLYK